MYDIKGLLYDIANGYKRILIFLAFIALAGGTIWGILSVPLMLTGKIEFQWWYILCWVLDLTGVAGCIGI